MRLQLYLLSLLASVATDTNAQGVVNKSLLQPPTGSAATTWSTRTFERAQGSVVYVAVEVSGPRGDFVIERASSGVVIGEDGYVLTFYRLVKEADGTAAEDKRIMVRLNDSANTELLAKIVRHDQATGLVLLKVDRPSEGLQLAKLAKGMPNFGEPVLVVARPAGEEMLAFAGVASRAVSDVELDGQMLERGALFLTDSRSDVRCDGASVFGADGQLLGLYSTEHVTRDVREPTLEDLKRPSFGVVVSAARARSVFAKELAASSGLRDRLPHSWSEAVSKVAPAVVGVYSGAGDWPVPGSDDPGCVQRRKGLGSGVVATADGLVIANAHVCEGSDVRVKVAGRVYPAEVIKKRGRSNLALLRVDVPSGVKLAPAQFAQDDGVQLGEPMLAVGNPTGDGVVVTGGVISAMRSREGGRIQADANLGNQNGGGAIINASGLVIGVGDAGRIDPIEMAFMMRGDGAKQETNLSTFVGVREVRRAFKGGFAAEGAAGSVVSAARETEAQLQRRRSALVAMVEKASGAMLNIFVARNVAEVDPEDPFPPDPDWQPMSLGSGVIIDQSGLAISNWHVVDAGTFPDGAANDEYRITARGFGGKEYVVQVLSISREDDLSLLQLELDEGETVQAVELGNSEQLAIGEAVAAIGNPHGRSNTITYGVVSAKGQGIRVRGRFRKLKHLLETDAAINGGNSGGALLDMDGRLVGINSAGGGTFNNVGYAIAVDHVRQQITGLLLQAYKLRSVDLGMRVVDDDDEGEVVIMDVDGRGPAALAGLESGDRITSLAGTKITWSPGFAKILRRQAAGQEVALGFERDGAPQTIEVTPLAPAEWGLIRQSGIRARDLGFVEDPERVRLACVALHRAFTGDETGEPQSIPPQVVSVMRVYEQHQGNPDLRPGDLLLAVELKDPVDGRKKLSQIESVEQLRDLFNDRLVGKSDGVDHYKIATEYPMWVARGSKVMKVNVRSVRLFW
jgi:serine protease Do